jgi:DNA-binding LacI/PurR family transcriptional regulator
LHGIRQAIQHLAALRHRRIAFVAGPLRLKSAIARRDAFLQSMQEIGLTSDPLFIVQGDHTTEGGMEASTQLLKASIKPTAIVCSNDLTAIGVMRKSYEEGIVIPRDLSLVGFDDVRLVQFMSPPLTTVQMSQADLATLAFKALLTEVERETFMPNGTEYVLRTNLLLRKSTAMAPTEGASAPPNQRCTRIDVK